MIREWITDIISGVGGMHDYERCEVAVRNGDPDEVVAIWVIKCLANPKCEGSKEVLEAIAKRRAEVRK